MTSSDKIFTLSFVKIGQIV